MADIKWPRSFRKATELPREEVAAIVEQLIAELDRRDPEDDLELTGLEDDFMKHEPDGPGCPISDPIDVGWHERSGMGFMGGERVESEDCEPGGDEQDIAWTEWHGRGRRRQRSAPHETVGSIASEDDEEDDASGQCDEDGINTAFDAICYTVGGWGAGCPISDPDAEHDGTEREQMQHDVPCIPVLTLEPNIFNGQRQLLGYTLPKPLRDGTVEPEL